MSFSPGVVDGNFGDNTRKALAAFQEAHDLPVTGLVDAVTWQNLLAASGGKPWALYTITEQDTKGPFYQIPTDMEAKAKLPAMGYSSPLELLAEQGIEPEKPPYSVREGGSRLCFVRDPDGYRVEILEMGST